ncbi:MAG: TrkH family potassium uptake protein [Phycisphaerae bacterium]
MAVPPSTTGDTLSRPARLAFNVAMVMAAVPGVATLVLEYGGIAQTPEELFSLHLAQAAAAAVFAAEYMARVVASGAAVAYIRENTLDFVLAAVLCVGALVTAAAQLGEPGLTYPPVIIAQAYLLIAVVQRAFMGIIRLSGSGRHGIWMLPAGFLLLCAAGSAALMLPAATGRHQGEADYINSLFTATSAACATSLKVHPTGSYFTAFGQSVILGLVQIGALAVMICGAVLAVRIGKGSSAPSAAPPGKTPSRNGTVGRIIASVVVATFIIELAGAVLMYPMFASNPCVPGEPKEDPRRALAMGASGAIESTEPGDAAWYSVFHSVSAFSNAGFSLYDSNLMQGALVKRGWESPLREHWQVIGVLAPLIVLGGLGFPVLRDVGAYVKSLLRRAAAAMGLTDANGAGRAGPEGAGLTLHTKVVLTMTVSLIVFGACGLLIVERPRARSIEGSPILGAAERPEDDWSAMGMGGRIREAIFQSVSARSGGFNTIDPASLSNASKLWMCLLMLVGTSPSSAGGGMRTVTFALVLLTAWAVLKRRHEADAFDRDIPGDIARRAMAFAAMYVAFVLAVTLALAAVMDPRESFINILFESCSACGNVGLSTGMTPNLPDSGKLILCVAMFVGRVGPLAFIMLVTRVPRGTRDPLPQERVLIV